MKSLKLFLVTITAICFICVAQPAKAADATSAEGKDAVQIAILLDTSSSMDGLIDQAKASLWKIVNEVASAKKNSKAPKIEVALYEYGKSSIPSEEGYIRRITQFTRDLDKISEELFALKTNGGDEYCGAVIENALDKLQWRKNAGDLKVIYIAGNEPFNQGSVDYKKACKNAASKNIIINTIFCGNQEEGIRTFWKDGADIAGGSYANIDQNKQAVYIKAPQDEELTKLGTELNKTYIAYGVAGKAKKDRQEEQDAKAETMGASVAVERAAAKSSAQYVNSSWDIVDAVQNKEVKISDIKKDELPEEMKSMNDKEKQEYINKISAKRSEIQNKMQKLNEERRKYIEKEMKKQSQDDTLDAAMIKSIRNQAQKTGFEFK